ncbi:bestrophin family protein [Skeletonema marinoi]|uniref:Bestrophin family protein n=1 Tax=Skeletonema marinoi TaxID=267567 RepID=A0AAD8YGZ8_9STRA|nr:bestrophin family protein [Skeletonema marinoi]
MAPITKMILTIQLSCLLLLLAASKVQPFQSVKIRPSPSRREVTLSYSTGSDPIAVSSSPRLSTVPSPFSTEDLDNQIDTYADPNDKRYSASDWAHNMLSLPYSTILHEIRSPVGWITAWSTLVSLTYKMCQWNGMQSLAQKMCLGPTPHSLIASSIGLLLVFRTNSAYQRKQRIQRLLAAFPYVLQHHIQPRCLDHSQCKELECSPHVLVLNEPRSISISHTKKRGGSRECWVDKRALPWCLLPDPVLSKLGNSHNRPLWVTDRLSLEITEIKYDDNFTSRERLELLKHTNTLSKCIGHCERIHQTAVPLNYARHALRSLTMWSFTLPFGVVDKLGLLTGPVVGIVAWLMYGVYEIGHRIEDPFQGSLRLTDLCNAIYRDVMFGDRNQAGMRRQSAFRKDFEKESDWDRVGDAFGVCRTEKEILEGMLEQETVEEPELLPDDALRFFTFTCGEERRHKAPPK